MVIGLGLSLFLGCQKEQQPAVPAPQPARSSAGLDGTGKGGFDGVFGEFDG